MLGKLGDNRFSRTIRALFNEYEMDTTPEAQFVHQLDKVEFALQTREYEAKYQRRISDFVPNARRRVHHPALIPILDRVEQLMDPTLPEAPRTSPRDLEQ